MVDPQRKREREREREERATTSKVCIARAIKKEEEERGLRSDFSKLVAGPARVVANDTDAVIITHIS